MNYIKIILGTGNATTKYKVIGNGNKRKKMKETENIKVETHPVVDIYFKRYKAIVKWEKKC